MAPKLQACVGWPGPLARISTPPLIALVFRRACSQSHGNDGVPKRPGPTLALHPLQAILPTLHGIDSHRLPGSQAVSSPRYTVAPNRLPVKADRDYFHRSPANELAPIFPVNRWACKLQPTARLACSSSSLTFKLSFVSTLSLARPTEYRVGWQSLIFQGCFVVRLSIWPASKPYSLLCGLVMTDRLFA